MSPDPLAMLLRSFKLPTMAQRYEETLAQSRTIDFNDMIKKATKSKIIRVIIHHLRHKQKKLTCNP